VAGSGAGRAELIGAQGCRRCGSHRGLTCSAPTPNSLEGARSFIVWIILGLIAGALAKFIVPGRDPGGIIVTILIGSAGALIGGYISTRVGSGAVDGIDLRSILIAVGGAIILLLILRVIRRGA
jgi:uncharacterized membrane protein YeaQ/YmgE (transglycosylase-associated protein family)